MNLQAAFQAPLTQLFATKVADYQAARPDYPAGLFDWLAGQLPGPLRVLDLGAGTGLFTQSLLAQGWEVLAVEPDAAMRAACDARLGAHPRYRSAAGQAEALPADAADFDLITAAQAFHWFDVGPAHREFARVLRPGGRVALVWNDRVAESALNRELDALLAEFGGSGRAAQTADDDRARAHEFLGAGLQQWTGPHSHSLDLAGLQALVFSRSYMPARDSAAGQALVPLLAALFSRHAANGRVELPYRTVCLLGSLRA
ncbi:MAG: class I SAM-dependent methyltransferase [Inhella sp.]